MLSQRYVFLDAFPFPILWYMLIVPWRLLVHGGLVTEFLSITSNQLNHPSISGVSTRWAQKTSQN